MKTIVVASVLLVLASATPAHAHRLDEYLQATTITVGSDRVKAQIRLTPGVAVFARVLAEIDANADGALSAAEQRAYAERVLRELSLAVDGTRVPLRLTWLEFASVAEMRDGRGEMVIDFHAVVTRGGAARRLTFENHHLSGMSVFLVNAIHPRDPDIQINRQVRNYEQSSYRMDYQQAGTGPERNGDPLLRIAGAAISRFVRNGTERALVILAAARQSPAARPPSPPRPGSHATRRLH